MSNFHFEVPHNFTPKDKKINLIKDSYNYVQKQTSALRRTWPEYMVLKVVTVYRDNTFDLTTPDEEHLFERVMAIDPRAKDFYRPGKAVTVRFNNVNGGRPYIKFGYGFMGDAVDLTIRQILFGDGSWTTPEADSLNSHGLTVANRQILLNSGGTLTTLESGIQRFSTAGGAGTWFYFVSHLDQLGLLAFTTPVTLSESTTTVLACFATLWDSYLTGFSSGQGAIREYCIGGLDISLHTRTLTYSPGYELRPQISNYPVPASDRNHGYFFVDIVTDSYGVYIVTLENGIIVHRRSDDAQHKSAWTPDQSLPGRTGSCSVYGQWLVEGCYTGYDKSQNALDQFNGLMQYTDPALAYLGMRDGTFEQIRLPDNANRAMFRFYVRDATTMVYTGYEIDLKAMVSGVTPRKVHSCGAWYPYGVALYDSGGTELDLGDGTLLLYSGADYNMQCNRWPWLARPAATEGGTPPAVEVWFWVCTQAGKAGDEVNNAGRSYWTLCALQPATSITEIKNQLITSADPIPYIEPYTGWWADQQAAQAASSAASLETGAPDSFEGNASYAIYVADDPGYVPEDPVNPVGGRLYVTGTTEVRLRGSIYNGTVANNPQNDDMDRFVPHPLPTNAGALGPVESQMQDGMVPTSDHVPSGCFDLHANHYCILGKPVKVASGIAGILEYDGEVPLKVTTETQTGTKYWFAGFKNILKPWFIYVYFCDPDNPDGEAMGGSAPDRYMYRDFQPYETEPHNTSAPGTDLFDFIVQGTDTLNFYTYNCAGTASAPVSPVFTPQTVDVRRYVATRYTIKVSTWETLHKTHIIKTSYDGATKTEKDISEYTTWDPLRSNCPVFGNCWQCIAVKDFLFIIIERVYSQDDPLNQFTSFEPRLEIYKLSDLTLMKQESLRPLSDTGNLLLCDRTLAPRMRVGYNSAGECFAQIFTEWITVADDSRGDRLEVMQHLKSEMKYKTGLTRTDHLFQGTKEAGIPLPTEASNWVQNGDNIFWIEGSNSVVKYTPLPP